MDKCLETNKSYPQRLLSFKFRSLNLNYCLILDFSILIYTEKALFMKYVTSIFKQNSNNLRCFKRIFKNFKNSLTPQFMDNPLEDLQAINYFTLSPNLFDYGNLLISRYKLILFDFGEEQKPKFPIKLFVFHFKQLDHVLFVTLKYVSVV